MIQLRTGLTSKGLSADKSVARGTGYVPPPSTNLFERFCHRARQCSRTVAAEVDIDLLKTPDQIDNLPSRQGSASGGTKMGAAPERTILVDQASAGLTFEERTFASGMLGQRFSAGGSKSPGCNNGFAFREVRRATS